MLDPILNFARVEVSIGYDDSAVSIILSAGEGAKLPDPVADGEFNLVWWDSTNYPNPSDDPNVEIVRVTARSTDTLTVTRNQEGTGASTKNTGSSTYLMILPLTKKTYDQLIAKPASSTDNAIARFDGADGKTLQNSGPTINDTGEIDMGSQKITSLLDPVSAQDAATKEYVDQSVNFINTYYFNDTASDIGGIYFKMLDVPTGEAESDFVSGTLGAGDDQALTNWATDAGIPGVNTLLAGTYSAHVHAEKTSGTKPVNIYFEIYTRVSGGAETLRATSEISRLITAVAGDVSIHATIAADVNILVTDRIIIKWFANVGATGSDVVVTLFAEGETASRFSIPTTTEVLSSVFIRQDGTTPFSGNQDFGTNDITGVGSLGVTGARLTKVWAIDLEITNAPTLSGVAIPSISSTDILTNKRITERVTTEASSATPTINTDNSDMHSITALAAAITSMTTNLSGTPTNGQKLIIRILDNGTGRAITWGASFEARGVDLPTTTTANKLLSVGFIYDTADSIWGCVAVADEE